MSRLRLPRSPAARAALAAGGLIAGLNLMVLAIDALFPTPGGAPSSSFATEPRGFAAWADLARAERTPVRALRRSPSRGGLPPAGTVVVLDAPRLEDADAEAIRRFAEAGGHVVAGGRNGDDVAAKLLDGRAPGWVGKGSKDARALLPLSQTRGVRTLRTAGEGSWRRPGAAVTAAGGTRGPLLLVATAGRGRISLLADSSPLQNRLLGQADNAALALALAGDGPLTFVESVHGYGEATGLAALPRAVKWTLGMLLAAALLLMVARGRRMGAPETLERPLPPPRGAYVDALADTLARADAAALGEPLRVAALDRLGMAGAPTPALREAALAAGLGEDEADVLTRPVEDLQSAMTAGRALARLEARTSAVARRIPA